MFNINGEEWRVVLVPPLHPELKRQDKGYTLGTCDDILKTMYLNRELNDEYLIAIEIGATQKDKIIALVNKYLPNSNIISKKDMQGRDRMIFIMNKK